MSTDALNASEALSARGATHPRVSVHDIEAAIASAVYLNLGDAIERTGQEASAGAHLMTLCVLTMDNGFVVVGKSAPASPENYDQAKGRTFAYEDAVKQVWPLMGYALRERLANG